MHVEKNSKANYDSGGRITVEILLLDKLRWVVNQNSQTMEWLLNNNRSIILLIEYRSIILEVLYVYKIIKVL